MIYTGAPDECSQCFAQGEIRKLDEKGECPSHPILSEGWVNHPKCGTHHISYRYCAFGRGTK